MTVGVLVADDQAPFRRAACSVLRSVPGFELVAEATSGEQAVALATALRPQLALIDIHMEGIGGIEAARRIAAACPATVTILLSTYRAEDVPARARTCGAAAYVHKADFGAELLRSLYDPRSDK